MDDPRFERLKELFQEAGSEHHRAFLDTDGFDPEWPLWYAGFLQDKLEDLLDQKITKSELADLLALADQKQRLKAPEEDWTAYYARFFLERYG